MASRRAQAYAARIPAAVSGAGGHNQTFSAAVALVHGFGLTESDAWPILQRYNSRCTPPWSEAELRHKLTSATQLTHHSRERGYLLTTPRPGARFARQRNDASPFPADHQIASTDATRSPFPDVAAQNRAGVPNFDLRGRLGQVRLRDLPELTSPTAPPKAEPAPPEAPPSTLTVANCADEDPCSATAAAPVASRPHDPLSQPTRALPRGCSTGSEPAASAADRNLGVQSSAFDVERSSDPSDAGPAIPDPPSSSPSSPPSTPETGPFARLRPGPTIQLPRAVNGSLQGFNDPRANPLTEWIHIQGYMSIPPKNCPVCWLQRSRSLWIGACICTSEISTSNGCPLFPRKTMNHSHIAKRRY